MADGWVLSAKQAPQLPHTHICTTSAAGVQAHLPVGCKPPRQPPRAGSSRRRAASIPPAATVLCTHPLGAAQQGAAADHAPAGVLLLCATQL